MNRIFFVFLSLFFFSLSLLLLLQRRSPLPCHSENKQNNEMKMKEELPVLFGIPGGSKYRERGRN